MNVKKQGLVIDGSEEVPPEPSPPPIPDPEPTPEDIPKFEIQVRAILGVDETLISNEIICLPLYKGKALRYAQEVKPFETLKKPSEEDWDMEKLERWQSIVVYKTALLLLPYFRIQWKKIQQSPSLKEENFEINWAALEKQLKDNLDEETATITGGGVGFSFFGVTNRGCRH